MNTADLRSLVKTAATGMSGARLWPNGLGFDLRGTAYVYIASEQIWYCARADGDATKYGEGPTPQAAKRAAGIGRPEHRIRGGVAPC